MPKHPFTDEELLIVFEASYQALSDPDMRDELLDEMDLSDEFIEPIIKKLTRFLDDEHLAQFELN